MWLINLFNRLFKRGKYAKNYYITVDDMARDMMVSGLTEEEVLRARENVKPVSSVETLTLKHFNIDYNTTSTDKIFIALQESFTDSGLPFGEGGMAFYNYKTISIREEDLCKYKTIPWAPYPSNLPLVVLKSTSYGSLN